MERLHVPYNNHGCGMLGESRTQTQPHSLSLRLRGVVVGRLDFVILGENTT